MSDGTRREVVVTGLGLVTPVGIGLHTTWQALLAGTPGGAKISLFQATDEYPSQIACEVNEFDPSEVLDAKEIRRYDRFAQFAVVAAAEAAVAAGLRQRKRPACAGPWRRRHTRPEVRLQ